MKPGETPETVLGVLDVLSSLQFVVFFFCMVKT